MQVDNDTDYLSDYEFYYNYNLDLAKPETQGDQSNLPDEPAPVGNLLAQQARYTDTISSAKPAPSQIEEKDAPTKSLWNWITDKGEAAWNKVKSFFTGETEPSTNDVESLGNDDTTSALPELDEPLEMQEMKRLRQDIRNSLEKLDQLEQGDDTPIDPDLAFANWLRVLSETEEQKSKDLLYDYELEKARKKQKDKKYFELCDEYIGLEEKRKIAEWVEWGASIGGMVVSGVLSLAGGMSGGEAFFSIMEGGTAAIQGTTKATAASFKYMTNQMKAQMIELKDKKRDQDDKVNKTIMDLGESYRRVAKYFQQLSKCEKNWRRTVISFFRKNS